MESLWSWKEPQNSSWHCRYAHTYASARAHTSLLLYTLSIKDVGQDLETMPLHSDRFGLVYDSSPFRTVFHYLLPVGHSYQVPADDVDPSQ